MLLKKQTVMLFAFLLLCITTSAQKTDNKGIATLWVKSQKTMCSGGVSMMDCYLVKESANQKDWHAFSNIIEGFKYQEGTEYVIQVKKEKIENPPADASNLKFTLVKIISSKKVAPNTSIYRKWNLISFDEITANPMPVQEGSYVTFAKNGKISGMGICNNMSGTVKISALKLKFGQIATTRKMCINNMEQETKFVNLLQKSNNYKLIGNDLMLYNGSTKLMTFHAAK